MRLQANSESRSQNAERRTTDRAELKSKAKSQKPEGKMTGRAQERRGNG